MMYVSQIIMMYTLNLHSDVRQLYLSKTGIKKSNNNKKKKATTTKKNLTII